MWINWKHNKSSSWGLCKGIEDIEEAKQPMFTSKPELERSGMGFSFMESFMDDMQVASIVGEGTKVIMTKTIEVPK